MVLAFLSAVLYSMYTRSVRHDATDSKQAPLSDELEVRIVDDAVLGMGRAASWKKGSYETPSQSTNKPQFIISLSLSLSLGTHAKSDGMQQLRLARNSRSTRCSAA